MRRIQRDFLVLGVVATMVAVCSGGALARDYTVDTTADDPALSTCDDQSPAPDCSLRGALTSANALPDSEPSTISLPAGTFLLTAIAPCSFRTSQLGTHNLNTTTLCVAGRITLRGSQGVASSVVIDGNGTDRVMVVGNDAPVRIEHVTIRGGFQQGGSLFGGGGGINNGGDLTLVDSVVTGNTARTVGGGIYSSSTLRVYRSRITTNTAVGGGGGVMTDSFNVPVDATFLDSEIASNTSVDGPGGGVYVYGGNSGGTTTIRRSTLSDNESSITGGGGIFVSGVDGAVNVENSTVSGNRAGWAYGGGIWNAGTRSRVNLRNATIAGNRSRDPSGTRGAGGGIANNESAVITLANTIVAGNSAPEFAPDCYDGGRFTTLTSDGHNIIGNQGGPGDNGTYCDLSTADGDQLNVDPQLEPLGDNGGLTDTHGTVEGSPAIDGGAPSGCEDTGGQVLDGDQRGEPRPTDGDGGGGARCDVGSVENGGGAGAGSVEPGNAGNGGTVCALIHGRGFADGTTVKLTRPAAADVPGTPVNVNDGGTVIATAFDLRGRATGRYDVVVTFPDASTSTLDDAFLVEDGGAPELWAEIVGPIAMRRGRSFRFFFMYGNRGNLDALGVPIQIGAAPGVALDLQFAVAPPPANPDQVFTGWDTIRTSVDGRPVTDYTIHPFIVPIVPAGFTGALEFRVTVAANAPESNPLLVPFIGAPYASPDGPDADAAPDIDPAYVQAQVENAQRYARDVLGLTAPLDAGFMTQYQTEQLERIVERGAQAWIDAPGGGGSGGGGGGGAGGADGGYASGGPDSRVACAYPCFAIDTPTTTVVAGGGQPSGGPASPAACAAPCFALDPPTTTVVAGGGQPPQVPVGGGGPGCSGDCITGCPSKKKWPGGRMCSCPPPTDLRGPFDPNGKFGASMGSGYVSDEEPLRYAILFENDPMLATAPAQEVVITDQLDVALLDLDSFSLGPIVFGESQVFPPAGTQDYQTTVDLRPAQNLLVRIRAALERATGVVTWRFTSLDPDTLEFPEDALAGFLPPNTIPPAGDGSVAFTVKYDPLLPSGSEICNQADIVFDTNAPIVTLPWCNRLDRDPPQSALAPLPAVTTTTAIPLAWSGSDVGSHIVEYQVFASADGGPYELVVPATLDTQATFTGVAGRSYAFHTVARDDAGNVEAAPFSPDAVTRIEQPGSARDMAVVVLRGPKRTTFSSGATSSALRFTVVLQNRGPGVEVIPDAAALAALVRLDLESIAAPACTPAPVVSLRPLKARRFPIRIKSKGKRAIAFEVRLGCAGDPQKGPLHEDYRVSARVDLAALGGSDGHAADDVCPRRVAPPGVIDPNPDGKILDKGCGARLADGTFGGPVLLDAVLKPPR